MSDDIFDLDSHQAKNLQEQMSTKGGYAKYDLKDGKNYFFLLPPKKGQKQLMQTIEHQLWGAQKKMISSCVPPLKPEDGEDKITKFAWTVKDKFKTAKDKKLQDLFKAALPSKQLYANVIDMEPYLNANSKGKPELSKVVRLPTSVANYIFEALAASEEEHGNMSGVSDFEKGCYFIVLKKGTGLNTTYIVKEGKEPVQLISKHGLDKLELAKSMYDLSKLQKAFNKDAYEAHFRTIQAYIKKRIAALSGTDADFSETTDDDTDEKTNTEDFDSTEDFDLGL